MDRARVALRALLGLALAACGEGEPAAVPRVVVAPILDSLFVGDTLPSRTARYYDPRGDSQATGPVRWASSNNAVISVDSVSGVIAGTGPGIALLSARANGITGTALLVTSRVLDLSLLLDTIYLMEGDTFTVPVSVRDTSGAPPPVWFEAPLNAVFDVDSPTGRVRALAPGGPLPFTAHADSVSASGVVEVVELTDTTGGRGSFSVLGSVIHRARAGARATHYRRAGDTSTFRVSLPISSVGGIVVENIVITLRDSVNAPGAFAVDSISLNEAFGAGSNFVCRPVRPWAIWSILQPPLEGLSGQGGALVITQVAPVSGGRVVSGRFTFTARRRDLYDDPLAALPIRGTFVAPLIADPRRFC